ncbi:hypothetical protein G6F46_002387 [Rhizopus delemar]|uniref:K Homology domain-containing protein n=3 Tax=Rhizopus TaxID=4842 RepID=I1BQK9_RHIO9|nr:hypothetical protein RO3G_03193 [Rhizopus delemar RA 99-880]KAG1465063.1 hypothetical protein G6F55_001377 [Rhizopus delemar]KAG1503214.1 hypothetical protein G6F54_001827 [Rhizopus delemar]KAG1522214.1 hypothetical protein G6F52_006054 [Rhizopus delemar]KAG1560823.1 hypothetical protein G6F49_002354 [Rhizopus delemar]|eukprot:EIE78489.1 hypothetical protein RO3G_03193 [Rhizopus delemar RA 99-880]
MSALSFCYSPPISGQYIYYDQDEPSTISRLRDDCNKVSISRGCQINLVTGQTKTSSVPLIDTPIGYNLTMTGAAEESLIKARGDLLQNCLLKIKLTLQISLMPDITNDLFTDLKEKFFNVKINVIQPKKQYSSLVSDNPTHIELIGPPNQVEECRVRVLVLLDEKRNLKTETVELPLKLHYLICGRKRCGLLPIIEETTTNIYFPSPFCQDENQQDLKAVIYITGEQTQVTRVKEMLNKLAVQKAKSMYHKDTELSARKIDWLLLYRRDELRKIMHDNGAYIMFPVIGSGKSRVTVYAENRVNAERTLRALNLQTCNIYEAFFYFNHQENSEVFSSGATLFNSPPHLATFVSDLSHVSGSEVLYKPELGSVEVLGSERAIRNVYQRLQEMQLLQVFHRQTVFRVESSNDHRDFISGKKNGKINKIMRTSGAKIKFQPFMNDYNFIIEVESQSFTKALDGLTLLQEELPAEISFYVPESYHKRIIGVGGKNIQRIMKRYGVFVKFSNTEEFASLGGYYNNEDNVVARTPMKNQINLDNLRHAVMELVQPRDRSYITKHIKVPFILHRELIQKYQADFIAEEIAKKTNTRVLWPDSELGCNYVILLGPEAHIPTASSMLETIVPETYNLYVPHSDTFPSLISSDAFQEKIICRFLQTYQIKVETIYNKNQDSLIRLHLKMSQIETDLPNVLNALVDYLKSENISLHEEEANRPYHLSSLDPISYMSHILSTTNILNHNTYTSDNNNLNPLPWTPVTQDDGPIPSKSTSAQSSTNSASSMPDNNNIRSIFNSLPLEDPVVPGYQGLTPGGGIWGTPSKF